LHITLNANYILASKGKSNKRKKWKALWETLRLLGYTACQHYGFRAKLHGGMTAIELFCMTALRLLG